MAYSWTGFYLGLNGGYGFGRAEFYGGAPGSFNAGGGLVGATVGYNWQTGPLVFGLEGDIDWSGQRGSGTCGGLACRARNDYLATIRGRLGYAMDRWMPYVTGGAAIGNVRPALPASATPTTPRPAGPSAAASKPRSWDRGRRRSSICTSISETPTPACPAS